MVQRCCVCLKAKSPTSTLFFYRFPKDPVLEKSWIEAIPEPNLYPSSKVICSAHFKTEDQFIHETTGKHSLYPGVIPSVFILKKSHLPDNVQSEKLNDNSPANMKRKCDFLLSESENTDLNKSSKMEGLPDARLLEQNNIVEAKISLSTVHVPENSLCDGASPDVDNRNTNYFLRAVDNTESIAFEVGTLENLIIPTNSSPEIFKDSCIPMNVITPAQADIPLPGSASNTSAISVSNAASESIDESQENAHPSSDFPAITLKLSSTGLQTDAVPSGLSETVKIKEEICDVFLESVTIKQEEIDDFEMSEEVSYSHNEFIPSEERFSPFKIPKTEISDLEQSNSSTGTSGSTEENIQKDDNTDTNKKSKLATSSKKSKEFNHCCACQIGSDNKFGVTLHRFPPNNSKLLKKWTEIMKNLQLECKNVSNLYLCSQHFLSSDFSYSKGNYNLKRYAVPSLFHVDLLNQKNKSKETKSANENDVPSSSSNFPRKVCCLSKVEDKVLKIFALLGLKVNSEDSITEKISTIYNSLMQDVEQATRKCPGRRFCSSENISKTCKELNAESKTAGSYFTISYEHASTLEEIVFTSGDEKYEFERISSERKMRNMKLQIERDYAIEAKNDQQLEYDLKILELEERNEQLSNGNELLNKQIIEIENSTTGFTGPKRKNLKEEIIELFGVPETICSEIVKKCIFVIRSYFGCRSYSNRVMNFSLLLYYFSKEAYDLVRNAFYKCLPEKSVLMKYLKKMTGISVSQADVFDALKKISKNNFIDDLSDALAGCEVDSPFNLTSVSTQTNEESSVKSLDVEVGQVSSDTNDDSNKHPKLDIDLGNQIKYGETDCDSNNSKNKHSVEKKSYGSNNIGEQNQNENSTKLSLEHTSCVKQSNSRQTKNIYLPKSSLGHCPLQLRKGSNIKRLQLINQAKLKPVKSFSLPKSVVLKMIANSGAQKVSEDKEQNFESGDNSEEMLSSDPTSDSLSSKNSDPTAKLRIENPNIGEKSSLKIASTASSSPLKLRTVKLKPTTSLQNIGTDSLSSATVQTTEDEESNDSSSDLVNVDMEIF